MRNLNDFIIKNTINVFVGNPALIQFLDESLMEHRDLQVASVGSQCPLDLYDRLKDKVRFINAYGPTECSVYSHAWHDKPSLSDRVPVGKPMHIFTPTSWTST